MGFFALLAVLFTSTGRSACFLFFALMSGKDERTLLSSGGPLMGFFALLAVLFTSTGRSACFLFFALMSGKDGRILLRSGGSLMHFFGVLSFLSLFRLLFDVVLWFFVLLEAFFELDGRRAVIW